MFEKKYTVTILDSKWQVLKRNINLKVVPRLYEMLYFDGVYFDVINVIHMLNEKQDIFIVIEKSEKQYQNTDFKEK